MDEFANYTCPSCGEAIDVVVDPSAGDDQQYVEDCPVCCRPNVISVSFDRRGEATVSVEPE